MVPFQSLLTATRLPSISSASYQKKSGNKTGYNSGYNENRRIIEIIDIIEKFMVISGSRTTATFSSFADAGGRWSKSSGTMASQDAHKPYSLVLTLGMGTLAGAKNGIGIAYFGAPAVVMTLAMNGIMEGLTLDTSGGMTCTSCASYAPPIIQAAVHGTFLGVPLALYLWLVVIVIVSFTLSFTRFGRNVYAIGNNSLASCKSASNWDPVSKLS